MNNHEQVTQEVRDAFDALCKGRVEAAVKAEREACAKVLDEMEEDMRREMEPSPAIAYVRRKAAAIRARGLA